MQGSERQSQGSKPERTAGLTKGSKPGNVITGIPAGAGRKLDNMQDEAVRIGTGPCLVIAGPGSGKTTVITMRIKYLTQELKVPPGEILVVTFTRAAAAEMKERYLKLVGKSATEVSFGTFHSIFYAILREEDGNDKLDAVDEDASLEVLKRAAARRKLDIINSDSALRIILSKIACVKSGKDLGSLPEGIGFTELMEAYDEELMLEGRIDFEDMLLRTRELFKSRKDVLRKWQDRFRYILVDEFQDINPVQYEIIRDLAGKRRNVFVVGDEDQSIYGFRGSEPAIMLRFPRDFPEAKLIRLSNNYRCGGSIVRAAGNVISYSPERFSKEIAAASGRTGKVTVKRFKSSGEQYRWTADTVMRLSLEHDLELSDIAVLVRTHSGARGIVRLLKAQGVYIKLDGEDAFLPGHTAVMDMFSYLRAAEGTAKRGDLLRIINKPDRGIAREEVRRGEVP
ncbi:MAG: ATP-dependent helicase, partial [Lachnospiraceae bacterium]|nr:ATP-dependent helicase [Lachnospiraceae bacterium]